MRTLYGLMQSPWTHRARWALDHHGIHYRFREHVPMLGELFLRKRAGVKKPTVPLLVDGDRAVMGSFQIARYAEAEGRGVPLFPQGREIEVTRWNDVAERMSNVGRVWLMHTFRKNKAAQREALPPLLPELLRAVLAPTAVMAASYLGKKHDVPTDVDGQVAEVMRPALDEVRAALASRSYLLGDFTYADITVSCALQAVRPHERAPIGPGTREAWTNEELASEYDDLLMWRDAIHRKHR